ncbi:MAG: Uma2 family endonuclease [Armatimonadaceae bacterium]
MIEYPDSDGKPIADNTLQFRWITTIKFGLEILFADNPDVFVAGDLLWYPVEGDNRTRIGPDALVVLGRPKGERGSYKQWEEEDIPPQVVFEVLSPGNRAGEMARKREFYERYGVQEYYEYDPDNVRLRGWTRQEDSLIPLPEMNGWVSPLLGIRFVLEPGREMAIYTPTGEPFQTPVEIAQERDAVQLELQEARERAERFAERLRALGIEPDSVE